MFFGVDTPPTSSWFLVFSFDSWYNSRCSHPVPCVPGLHGLGAHRVDVEMRDGQKLFAARAKQLSMKTNPTG